MTDIILPLALRFASSQFKYIDQTGITRGIYTGAAQTTGYGGDRVGATLEFIRHGGRQAISKSERAQLQSFLMALKGKQNRVYIADDSNTRRGSFPATELFVNADLSSTSGWSVSNGAISVSDGVLRLKVTGSATSPQVFQQPTVAAYTPYVVRALIADGRGTSGLSVGPALFDPGSVTSDNGYSTSRGYRTANIVTTAAGAAAATAAIFSTSTGYIAGDYLTVPFASLSQCFRVDGGGNLLLQSEDYSNASWTKTRTTATANTTTAPDGTATADNLSEDGSAATTHVISQGVTVAATTGLQYSFSVSVKASNRTWVQIQIIESTSSHAAFAYLNLATGALGVVGTTGANITNVRAAVVDQGAGWYQLHLTACKASAATTLTAQIAIAEADNDIIFSGLSQISLRLWRASLREDSLPNRGAQTTTLAVATATQTGSALYVKGLPASTAGLLLQGDWFEIDGQLKMVTVSLDSDAAGIGHLQFSPPLRRAVSDNTPVIVNRPMGRFLAMGDIGWGNEPGVFSTTSIELEEAFS